MLLPSLSLKKKLIFQSYLVVVVVAVSVTVALGKNFEHFLKVI